MAFDGIITKATACELSKLLVTGKIEKIYQPSKDELLLNIHAPTANVKLLMSCGSQSARVCITAAKYTNPASPTNFCMLLRKHIQGGKITAIRQHETERIIEIDVETITELGFQVSKRLIAEIMGRHSNIVLIDMETGKITDSIKRISIDINRYRQLLPGVIYKYPPLQDKISFKSAPAYQFPCDAKLIMAKVSGISPSVAREMAASGEPSKRISEILFDVENISYTPRVYVDERNISREFHITELNEYEGLKKIEFSTVSECVEFYYSHKESGNILKQKSVPLTKKAKAALEKACLKKKRLGEDIIAAKDSDKYRLYGELLTANLHRIKVGEKSATVTNYYNGETVEIPISEKLSPSQNARRYFKLYSKSKTALKEKALQLKETEDDIKYLESVIQSISEAKNEDSLLQIRDELVETGYMRFRKNSVKRKKNVSDKPPEYILSDGSKVLAGRNNKENDRLTFKYAKKSDIWLHTKDIPGSHVILVPNEHAAPEELSADTIYEAAAIAAYHSKAKNSDNVPVDYVPVRYVKKPNGAKPGMVIFTNNSTVYVNPKIPDNTTKTAASDD